VRRRVVLAVLLPLLLVVTGLVSAGPALTREALSEIVTALTAPDMDGRRSGTPGGDRAASYIADTLRKAGCASFLQSFVIAAGTRLAASNTFDIPNRTSPIVSTDWTPHAGSTSGDVTAEVVFVGYGISAPEQAYDDYAGVDVKDRIVLAFAGQPSRLGRRLPRVEKIVAAREHGARALLVIDDPLPSLSAAPVASPIVTASVRRSVAEALLPAGTTLASLEAAPRALSTGTTARIRVALEPADQRGVNVLCVVPGTDPALAGETVVVGAHYDHLGRVEGAVHPGADDNASGTAVVLSLARAFLEAGGAPRTLVFALFGAEEIGLVGSRHYVAQPARPLDRTVAMVNLDMVGRASTGKLAIGGVDSAAGLGDTVKAALAAESLAASLTGSPFGPSDHSSFYRAGVPALFFHTGSHADYHRPSDTADKLDLAGMARIAAATRRVVETLAAAPRPVYATIRPPTRSRVTGAYAFLGVQSDGGADGARLVGVVPGSAADRAGLREGDVVIRLAGAALASFEDLRVAVRKHSAGERVDVVYVRNGERFSVSTTLGGQHE